jgi:hypothetical protein
MSMSSLAGAQPRTSVFTSRGPTTQASYDIVTDAGCSQTLTFSVNSGRTLTVDHATDTVAKETFEPALQVILQQQEGPGCEAVTASTLVEPGEFTFSRQGADAATLTFDDAVVSDPLLGTITLAGTLQFDGTGPTTSTKSQDRFCDPESGVCFIAAGVNRRRAANVTGNVSATVDPLFGEPYTDDYSPSAGTNVFGVLESSTFNSVTRSPNT